MYHGLVSVVWFYHNLQEKWSYNDGHTCTRYYFRVSYEFSVLHFFLFHPVNLHHTLTLSLFSLSSMLCRNFGKMGGGDSDKR
jgi:hypothetical protein